MFKQLPEPEQMTSDRQLNIIYGLEQLYQEMSDDTLSRLSNYRHYLENYKGNFDPYFNRPQGRSRRQTNWCARAVRMLANFTLPDIPEISVPRESELGIEADRHHQLPDFGDEFNNSEIKEKELRRHLNAHRKQGKKELRQGLESSLILGDAVLYYYWDKDSDLIRMENIFPGFVRPKFSQDNFENLEYVFITRVMHRNYIKRRYGQVVSATKRDEVATATLWDGKALDDENYALVKIYIDHEDEIHYTQDAVLQTRKHKMDFVPLEWLVSFDAPFSPYGNSYLKDLIPLNHEHNEAISDENDIVKIFSNPKVVISNATQRDIDNIKKMWSKGVIASKGDLKVEPFEFKSEIFPIAERIQKIEDRFYKISGLGPMTFGMPPGSINTGASLTVQFAPTLQQAQIVWGNWEPRLLNMFSNFLKMIEKKKPKMKKYIDGNYEVVMNTPFRVPREESVHIANVINKLQAGTISRTTAMQELGIKSPQDELVLAAYEKLNPLLSPELAAEMQQQQQPPPQQPQTAAREGGRQRAEQARQATAGGVPVRPQTAQPRSRGSFNIPR